MDVAACIRSLRAVRRFQDVAVPDDVLRSVIDTARWTGSSKNRQPWHFILVRDRETLGWLATCGEYAAHLATAPLALVIAMEPDHPLTTLFDAGRVAQSLMLAAWDVGLGSCVATLTDQETAKALLETPDDVVIAAALSLGYPAPRAAEPGERARSVLSRTGRKDLSELIHWERW